MSSLTLDSALYVIGAACLLTIIVCLVGIYMILR